MKRTIATAALTAAALATSTTAVPHLYHRNEDGSTTPAEPLGWQGGYDWEVYADTQPMRANLYDEDMLIATVEATSKRRLAKGMRREQKRLGITKATAL